MKDDRKKLIGEYLKAADRFIQASEFTQAMIEVKKALALEPGNMYALAYSQRIKAALESLRKKEEAARVRRISDEKQASAKKEKKTEERDTAPVESPKPEEAPVAPSAVNDDDRYTIMQQQVQIERFKEEIETLRLRHQQEISVLAEELRQARADRKEVDEKYQALVDDAEESHRRGEELYAEVVRLSNERNASPSEEAGPPRPMELAAGESLLREIVRHLLLADTLSAEANDVMELVRMKLGFDDDEFVRIQTSVKSDIYKEALAKAWSEGYITPEQAAMLSELRRKIGVLPEEHFELEAELQKAKRRR
ncbi:MAG: hypothetical protein ACM3Q4_10830 [Acidobacteriota bacterium]